MRILIVGAGQVGTHLAERLALEGQDVVVIEDNAARAAEVQETVDCLVIHGNGSSPAVLEEAGMGVAGMLIAVTSSDAANVLACEAGTRIGVPLTIARVEDPSLKDGLERLGVDAIIDPGERLAQELLLLVRQGGVSEVVRFAEGRLVMLGGYISDDAPVAGIHLAELRQRVSGWDWLVSAIIRDGETIVARGDTEVHPGDHVLLMAKSGRTKEAFELLGLEESPARKVMIFGATRLAQLTADLFARNGINTILVDTDAERCRHLAASHERVIVVQGDPTEPRVLKSEGVEGVDVVLGLTGWDEVNVLACLVAKALGARKTVARFSRLDLVRLLGGVGIDAAVSSRMAAANAILRYVRRGHIHSVVTFQDTKAEAIELEVSRNGAAVGKSLADIHLPHSVIVGGVLRGKEAFVPHGDTVVRDGDRLIVFALPEGLAAVEKLFGV